MKGMEMLIYFLVMIIIVYLISISYTIGGVSLKNVEEEAKVEKLFALSEFVVKNLSRREGDRIYINWVEDLDSSMIKKEARKLGLENAEVSFEKKPGTCIYRIIAFGDKKEIRKLYFCGG